MNHKISFKITGPSHIKTLPNGEGFEVHANSPIEVIVYNGEITREFRLPQMLHWNVELVTREEK